jgi:hypothetical protein
VLLIWIIIGLTYGLMPFLAYNLLAWQRIRQIKVSSLTKNTWYHVFPGIEVKFASKYPTLRYFGRFEVK